MIVLNILMKRAGVYNDIEDMIYYNMLMEYGVQNYNLGFTEPFRKFWQSLLILFKHLDHIPSTSQCFGEFPKDTSSWVGALGMPITPNLRAARSPRSSSLSSKRSWISTRDSL